MYTNVVFSGGGLACLSSFACANALRHVISGAHTIVGTSAGSLVAALVAMDAEEGAVYSKFIEVLGATKPLNHVKVGNIFESFGSMRSEAVTVPVISKVFMDSYNMAEICAGLAPSHDTPTFRDFARVTGKNLVISAVNVTKGKTVFFSVDTHPDQDVVQAIAASCAVPLLLSPVKIAGDLYVDAGLTDNLPVAALGDNSLPHQTLAIDTIPEESNDNEIVDVLSYFRATLLTVVKECNARNRRALDCDRICLNTGHRSSVHVETFLGTVDQVTVDSLYTAGIAAAREFEEGTPARGEKTTDPDHK